MYEAEAGDLHVPAGQADTERGLPPELALDLWRVIWGKLCIRELARLAGVSRAWRKESAECIACRCTCAVAMTLVKAPEFVPDCSLTGPQRALRPVQRILLWQDPFTGDPLTPALMEELRKASRSRRQGDLFFPGSFAGGMHHFYYRHVDGVSGLRLLVVSMFWHWLPPAAPEVFNAFIQLQPASAEEAIWMQGLLLALVEKFRGSLRTQGQYMKMRLPDGEANVFWTSRLPSPYNSAWNVRS